MKLSIRSKLLLGFLSVLVLFAVVSVTALIVQRTIIDDYDEITDVLSPVLVNMEKLRGDVLEEGVWVRGYLLTYDPSQAQAFNNAAEQADNTMDTLDALVAGTSSEQYLDQVRAISQEYTALARQLLESGGENGAVVVQTKGQEILARLYTTLEQWRGYLDQRQAEMVAAAARSQRFGFTLTLVLLVVALLLGLGVALLLSSAVTRGLAQLTQIAGELAAGNLMVQMPEIRTGDEVEELGQAVGVACMTT